MKALETLSFSLHFEAWLGERMKVKKWSLMSLIIVPEVMLRLLHVVKYDLLKYYSGSGSERI